MSEKIPVLFVGRQDEIRILRETNWRGHAQLVVIYGRRRVGKTALVHEAYKDESIWKFEGLESLPQADQIQNFVSQLAIYVQKPEINEKNIRDWPEALALLDQHLANKSVVVFFDEFQWLAGMKPHFVSIFKTYWDNAFQNHKKCRFVICGSISSFIVRNVLKSKALYGRIDTEIHLRPLPISESRLFFPHFNKDEILKIHMTFGGIPKYLKEINPQLSYQQNLNEYAFHQQGFFFQEFHRLFISHFATTPHYEKMLVALAQKQATLDDLARICRMSKGGGFLTLIEDLVLAGFIQKQSPIDKPVHSRILRFKLLDEYLHFYFTFIRNNVMAIQQGNFLYHLFDRQKLRQWQGFAFERLCLREAKKIADVLRFSGIRYQYGPWFRHHEPKAQVDLMFLRDDAVITLCEMKYMNKLPSSLVTELKRKVEIVSEYFPRHKIQTVLVCGIKALVPNAVTKAFDQVLFAEDVFF